MSGREVNSPVIGSRVTLEELYRVWVSLRAADLACRPESVGNDRRPANRNIALCWSGSTSKESCHSTRGR